MGVFDELSEEFEETAQGLKAVVLDPVSEWAKNYAEQVGQTWTSFASKTSKDRSPFAVGERFGTAIQKTITPAVEALQISRNIPIVGDIMARSSAIRDFESALTSIEQGAAGVSNINRIGQQINNALNKPDDFDQEELIDSTVKTLGIAARYNPRFGKQVLFAEQVTGVDVEDVLRDITVRSIQGDFEGVSDVPLEQLEAGLKRKLGPEMFAAIMGDSYEEQSDSVSDIRSMLASEKDNIFSPILPWDCSTYNMLTENPQYLDTLVRFSAHESGFPEELVEKEILKWWGKMKRVCELGVSDAYIQDPPFQLSNPTSVLMRSAQPSISYDTLRSLNSAMSGRVGSYMNALMTQTNQPIAVRLLSALSSMPWNSAPIDYPRLTMGSWRNYEAMPPEIRHWILENERVSGIRPYNIFTEPDGGFIMNVPTSASFEELQENMIGLPVDATDIVLVSSGRGAYAAEQMSKIDSRVRVIAIDGYLTGQAPKEKILQIVTGRDPLAALHSITPYNAYISEGGSNLQTTYEGQSELE